MLPSTCLQLACRNIDVKKGITTCGNVYRGDPARNAARCPGTSANCRSNSAAARGSEAI